MKWELISAHTFRRSYITLALGKGKLPETVMQITGHSNRTAFDKYVKITQNQAIKEMRDIFD
jgi:integrase